MDGTACFRYFVSMAAKMVKAYMESELFEEQKRVVSTTMYITLQLHQGQRSLSLITYTDTLHVYNTQD